MMFLKNRGRKLNCRKFVKQQKAWNKADKLLGD